MREIKLSKDKVTIVDDEDYEYLNQWKWYLKDSKNERSKTMYVERSYSLGGKRHTMIMHRIITKANKEQYVDHINGDGLDNRRSNLRLCTQSQNVINFIRKNRTTNYRGVEQRKIHKNSWFARIKVDGKRIYLGNFKSPEEAARAYNEAAKKYHGGFAVLNDL